MPHGIERGKQSTTSDSALVQKGEITEHLGPRSDSACWTKRTRVWDEEKQERSRIL